MACSRRRAARCNAFQAAHARSDRRHDLREFQQGGDALHLSQQLLFDQFFQDCDTDYRHDGSTRAAWVADVLKEILEHLGDNLLRGRKWTYETLGQLDNFQNANARLMAHIANFP